MRILLVVPPASYDGPLTRPRHAPHVSAMVAAALREAGHDVQLHDQTLAGATEGRLVADTRAARAELVLLCVLDYNRAFHESALERAAAALRRAGPAPVLGFGRLADGPAARLLRQVPSLPGLIFDEPEFGAVAVAAALQRGGDAREVPGTAWQDGRSNPPEAVDLDRAPIPAWDLVAMDHYGFSPHQQPGELVYPVLISRGCPYPCFFCEVQVAPRWRTRSPDAVIAELNALHARWGTRWFFFADPTFGVRRDEALELCRRLPTEGPPGLRWSCMCRTDRVDAELLTAMAAAGCWSVLFGVESLDPAVLERTRKQLDPSTVGPAIAAARAAGLETIVSLMIGLPGDTPAGWRRTLDGIIRMGPDFAQFFVVQIGEDVAPPDGRVLSGWDGSRFEFWGHVWAPEAFGGRDDLERLRGEAYRRFYLRPRYLARRAYGLWTADDRRQQLGRLARGGLLALRMATASTDAA